MKKILIAVLLVLSVSVKAQFVEGKHYEVVGKVATEKPTVTEFFSLFCGHCYQFESMLSLYKGGLKEGTQFEKSHVDYIPRDNKAVSFGIVKAFLSMKSLNVEKELIPAFFKHIHAEMKPIETEKTIKEIFMANGVAAADFDKAYMSKKVEADANKMIALWQEKKITNVPTMVVNGKYKINMQSVSSLDELTKLTNFLLDKK